MELDKKDWDEIKAIIKAARSFVHTYERATGHPFDGYKFDELKKSVKSFDANSPFGGYPQDKKE